MVCLFYIIIFLPFWALTAVTGEESSYVKAPVDFPFSTEEQQQHRRQQQVQVQTISEGLSELIDSSSSSYSNFAELVVSSGGDTLLNQLGDENNGQTTVFGPNNNAFQALGENVKFRLEQPEYVLHMQNLLSYHSTVDGYYLTKELLDSGKFTDVTMLNNETLLIDVLYDKGATTVFLSSPLGHNQDEGNALASICEPNVILASNGIMHGIDGVLYPAFMYQDLWEKVETIHELSSFVSLIQSAGSDITDLLGASSNEFTILAPSNDAIDNLSEDNLSSLQDMDTLQDVLKNHILTQVLPSVQIVDGESYSVLGPGSSVTARVSSDNEVTVVSFEGAKVVLADQLAWNGVIHVIDAVLLFGTVNPLLPPSSSPPTPPYIQNDDEISSPVIAPPPEAAPLPGETPSSPLPPSAPSAGGEEQPTPTVDFLVPTLNPSFLESNLPTISTSQTLLEVVSSNPSYSSLAQLVQGTPTVAAALSDSSKEMTLFGPNNTAVSNLGPILLERLQEEGFRLHLENLLAYHDYGQASLTTSELSNGSELVMLNQEVVRVDKVSPTKIRLDNNYSDDTSFLATVIEPNVLASNGVFHGMDGVLLPSFVYQDLLVKLNASSASEDISVFIDLLYTAGLQQGFVNGEYTILAPRNSAFDQLADEVTASLNNSEDGSALRSVLLNHALSSVLPSTQIVNGGSYRARSGISLTTTITNEGNIVFNNNATVVSADLLASNGIIHIIDAVIFAPPSNNDDNVDDKEFSDSGASSSSNSQQPGGTNSAGINKHSNFWCWKWLALCLTCAFGGLHY